MIKQLRVSLANQPGTLLGVVSALAEAGVDLKALQVNDRGESGDVRLIVSDLEQAARTLRDAGQDFAVDEVVVAEMDDKVGGLAEILSQLGQASINVEALYAFVTRVKGKSLAVMTVSDKERAESVLEGAGFTLLSQEDELTDAARGDHTSLEDHLGVDFIW